MSTTGKQITDILPSYISLYRTAASATTEPPPTSNRTTILKWFTTLSSPQRLTHLTIVDPTFTQLLLRMLSIVRRGHSTFFVLTDIPSSDSPNLPSLCSRKSRGLLGRVADSSESARLIRSSIRLFSYDDDRDRLDTVSFCEGFVDDVDKFVEVMDSVSDSGFLNGSGLDWAELGSEWVELGWLKAKGYYSMEAFVGNRVEVALRMGWLNSGSGSNSGKKRGVKLKEKVSNAVGVGVNVYWRKRGCVEWWERLDYGVKKKLFLMVLRKTAKSLTGEILKGVDEVVDSSLLHFGEGVEQPVRYSCYGSSSAARLQRAAELGLSMTPDSTSKLPISLVRGMNKLLVLQIIVAMISAFDNGEFDKDKLFFSSLSSVNTIFDKILMKLRGLLMAVSLESTNLELLEVDNQKSMPNKPKEKVASTSKKKGKNRNAKKFNLPEKNCEEVFVPDKALKDSQSGLASNKNSHSDSLKRMDGTLEKVNGPSLLTSEEKEEKLHTSAADRLQTSAKNRRQKKKKKARGKCEASSEVLNISIASSSCTPKQCEMEQCEKDNSADVASNVPQGACASQTREENLACFRSEVGYRKEASHNTEPDSERCPIGASGGELHSIHKNEVCSREGTVPTVPRSAFHKKTMDAKKGTVPIQERDNWRRYSGLAVNSSGYPSYEWPTVTPLRVASFNSQHLPPATDRLHLEVGHNWQNHVQHSYIQQIHQANTSIEGGTGRVIPRPLLMSFDCPPMVRACNYDLGQQAAAQQVFSAPSPHYNGMSNEEDKKYSADCFDFSEPSCTQEIGDEYDSHWVSEEEYEIHTVSGIDYNQFFGGGVMYWDPSDYRGAGFSRPPSLSSDDSSWAWREADMNRTVDDMVAFSSYSTNGLTSPSAAPFCSPFEPLPPGHQAIGYVRPGKEVTGKVLHTSTMSDLEAEEKVPGSVTSAPSDSDAKSGDSLPYPILRPIIIPNISRERSRSEFKGNRELRSPRVPPNRREQPRIKRPPSPVVLCVPRAPRPPTPSVVGDSRKHRGFPTVRSGSSSPRHWGSVRGWFNDGSNFEEACVRVDGAEVVWPSWGSKKISARQMIQPIPAAILQDRLIAISQLAHDQEHPDIALPLQPPELLNCPIRNASFSLMHSLLHDEIDSFCKQVAAENLIRRPYINWAVKRVTRSLQVLWPRSRTNIFGSNATGVSLPTSDVDLVVCLPPVRNLEPIKEAGILEGRNSIKETCLQHAARYLGNQEWVKADSIKTVENTAIPIIMLEVDVPHDLVIASSLHTSPTEQNQLNNGQGVDQNGSVGSDNSSSGNCSEINCGKDAISVRLDISFKSPSHTGLQTTELVKQLTGQFTAAIPLALVLKQFLADRSLDQSYSGGLSSYCLVLLITRFLQHEHHHGRSINQNLGSLFMDFLYFFGNVFDPRQMRISIQGSGLYINRERGYSIDPIYIDDPLFSSSTNNVGKNCFRIHQCIKAFADAYSTLETELSFLGTDDGGNRSSEYRLLPKIISSISLP